MCQFASGLFRPDTMEVRVADLSSHSETQRQLGLSPESDGTRPDGWREFHYTPAGQIQCRVLDGDSHTAHECESAIRARWPEFNGFLRWALANCPNPYPGSLDLRRCALTGVTLPDVGGWLYLRGCDLTGVDIPARLRDKLIQ